MAALVGAKVHLFDVGDKPYGDCALIVFDTGTEVSVLIDGGHRPDRAGILAQLAAVFGHPAPFLLDLLIISHAHDDHVGALPEMIAAGDVTATHALIPALDIAFDPAVMEADSADVVTKVLALLREEPPEDGLDSPTAEAMAADAVGLRDRYAGMIDSLNENGCNVVQFGSSPTTELRKLEDTFSSIFFKILGPARPALLRTRDLLFSAETDAVTDAIAAVTDSADTLDLLASLDASRRVGHLVNAQSIVCTFNATPGPGPGPVGQRILFGGDYQFADLGTSDPVLVKERQRLIGRIAAAAPYAFAKLSHHGSDNAVDAEFLAALGDTEIVGIICGRGHAAHPDPDTLALLDEHQEPSWVRTDRSGHIVVAVNDFEVHVEPDGALNIADTNQPDAGRQQHRRVTAPSAVPSRPPSAPAGPTGPRLPTPPPPLAVPAAAANERVTVEIPARTTTVTIRLDLTGAGVTTEPEQVAITVPPVSEEATPSDPRSPSRTPGPAAPAPAGPAAAEKRFQIAAGRQVGRLLFLTDTVVLGDHIGANVVAIIAAAVSDGGHHMCDIAPLRTHVSPTADEIAAALLEEISAFSPTQVVILGGYDVVPAHQIDTIAPETPEASRNAQRKWDPDGFIVWSDDQYVDIEGAGFPDLPISRIPDGREALFTLNALQAAPQKTLTRNGVRNSRRPFADAIFAGLPGTAALLVSGPRQVADIAGGQIDGAYQYHMLHGKASDGTLFQGERSPGKLVDAITLANLPTSGVDVAVLGCCWGALTTDTKASSWTPGTPLTSRVPGQSIALSLIAAGARAVIGCTGAHYSPTRPPFNSNAGPLHLSLWQRICQGDQSPAEALFNAKSDFAQHVSTVNDANELAICNKTLSQFTCLGLGC